MRQADTIPTERSEEATGPTIRIPGPLRALADGTAELVVPATTVGGALQALLDRHPALRRHLLTDADTLREHVNVFLNEDDIRHFDGEATRLSRDDTLTIVPSIAGG